MWLATVLTLFPELFPGPLGASLSGKALQERIWRLDTINIRDFGIGKHRAVDDTPAGGGAGMVLRADVAAAAIDAARAEGPARPLIYLSPRGKPLGQQRVRELANAAGVILFCGRFEGLDERVIASRQMEEISVGDFVTSGGEIPAMAVLDASLPERKFPGTYVFTGCADVPYTIAGRFNHFGTETRWVYQVGVRSGISRETDFWSAARVALMTRRECSLMWLEP